MRTQLFSLLAAFRRGSAARRGFFAMALACSASLLFALYSAQQRARTAAERLNSAAVLLDSLTDVGPADTTERAAIAWGYAERLRTGLESPFRLIESAARDPRLSPDERRTVSWALLARVMAGETHQIDPAALDGVGSAPGDHHLGLIRRAVGAASDARAGELGARIAYTLAAAEGVVETSSIPVVAAVAALLADREIARDEARAVVRADADPIAEILDRRARRSFYLERPALFTASPRLEGAAVDIAGWLLDSLRTGFVAPVADTALPRDSSDLDLARLLYKAAARMPPAAPLVVNVKRHLPVVRSQTSRAEASSIGRAMNPEMLAAALVTDSASRMKRRAIGRLVITTAVALRSQAQDPVWFQGDSAPAASEVAASIGVADITFDADVPQSWRPYFLRQLSDGIASLRQVLPSMRIEPVHIRFRMTSPADSALAMHDPRTRTLHLPVLTAAGTLTHELAHELDRQVAVQQGHPGYRSDFVTRNPVRERSRRVPSSVSASLRALTEDVLDAPARASERPAEIFATQVDWFVARALASRGLSNGFLTAVQDEILTGHVVHPERLRSGGKARPLLDALRGMTSVAAFASVDQHPSIQALLRWSLGGPIDVDAAASILSPATRAWDPPRLEGAGAGCSTDASPRAQLVRMAAESRARGWIRLRARWSPRDAGSWSHAVQGQGPWAADAAERRVAQLRDHILTELATGALLPSGLAASAAPIADAARCL